MKMETIMEPLKMRGKNPEAIIQDAIIKELRFKMWFVKDTHGNMYQSGFPDLYCCHRRYGARWLEVKTPHRTGTSAFTPAQLETFPLLVASGAGVWVASSHEGVEEILMKPCNWWQVLQGTKGF
jgi:hypothetical protein